VTVPFGIQPAVSGSYASRGVSTSSNDLASRSTVGIRAGGAQRGTSRREDVLDTVMSLRRPADYQPDQGARFEVHFEKARGDEAKPFEARYEIRDAGSLWTRTEIVDAERARVDAALKDGMSIREAAEELGIHRSKVERLRKKAIADGELVAPTEAAE
jgi:hypothetical protein